MCIWKLENNVKIKTLPHKFKQNMDMKKRTTYCYEYFKILEEFLRGKKTVIFKMHNIQH